MAPHLIDQLKPVNMWHSKISNEDARRVRVELAEGFIRRSSRRDLCACCLEQLCDQRQRVGVVINGQDVNPS